MSSTNFISVLIYDPDPVAARQLCDSLILNGYAPRLLDGIVDLPALVSTGLFRLLICDCAPDRLQTLEFVHTLREKPEFRFLQVFWMIERANKELILSLVQKGFNGFLARPYNHTVFQDKLTEFISRIQGSPMERRQHVRIDIPNYDNAKLVLTTPSGRKVTARVKNISVGGVFVNFLGDRGTTRLSNGDVVANALLIVGGFDIFVDIQVMAITEAGVGFKFVSLDERKLRAICSFIYDRIQSENLHARL